MNAQHNSLTGVRHASSQTEMPVPERPLAEGRLAGMPRRGSTIVLALAFGVVLLIVVGGLRSFSSYRIQSSIRLWNNLKAEAAAEAGLGLILTELGQNPSFETHTVTNAMAWGGAKSFTVKGVVGVTCSNDSGNFAGDIGGGHSFRARVGLIPYLDDPATKTIDESKGFLLVESIGKFESFGRATCRKVTAVVNRRFPAKECLMYDGQILSIVYGETSNTGTNIFADGNLYGHLGVEIGRIMRSNFGSSYNGTDQKLENVDKIMSGKGGVFVYSPVKFKTSTGAEKTFDTANTDALHINWGGTYGPMVNDTTPYTKGKGGYPTDMLNGAPLIQTDLKENVRDKNNPTIMNPAYLPVDYFKGVAGSVTSGPKESHKSYTGGNTQMVVLDFGDALRPGNSPTIPSSGVIYSDDDIVIRGNPGRQVTIVSKKNVYVDGDFNQKGSGSGAEKYCYPQDYNGEPKKPENTNYRSPYNKLTPGTQYQIARVYANERLVFDYSNIKHCLGNELYPYLKFRVAKEINCDDSRATNSFLKVGGDEKIASTTTVSYTYTKTKTEEIDSSGNVTSSNETQGDEATPKSEAVTKGKENIVKPLKEYITKPDSLKIAEASFNSDLKPLLDPCVSEDTGADPQTQESSTSNTVTNSDGSKTKTTTTTVTKKVTIKFDASDPAWSDNFGKKTWGLLTEIDGQKKLCADQISKFGSSDQSNDYLFYPELTTVGMFVSYGKRSPDDCFCAGPDVAKHFEEMGRVVPDFIHRLYGSQTAYRVNDVTGAGPTYDPPVRKKVYDPELFKVWDSSGPLLDVPTYGVLTWRETAADGASSF